MGVFFSFSYLLHFPIFHNEGVLLLELDKIKAIHWKGGGV